MAGEIGIATQRVCKDLDLWPGGPYTQDWAYELPSKFRTYEYFTRYIAAYSNPGYGEFERYVLMELMIDITNDLLDDEAEVGNRAWNNLVEIFRAEPERHRDLIEYWAREGEPLEDSFRLTPLVRALQKELKLT